MTAVEKFDTMAGEILWDHSFPPLETADKMYELMDFQRACQLYLWSLAIVGQAQWRSAYRENFPAFKENSFVLAQSYEGRLGVLTVNQTSEYFFGWIFDLPVFANSKHAGWKKLMIFIPLAPAIFLTVFYKVDLVSVLVNYSGEFFEVAEFVPVSYSVVGAVVTGIMLARYSSWIHDLIVSKLKKYRAEAQSGRMPGL